MSTEPDAHLPARLVLDPDAREVYLDGNLVELTRAEFDMLDLLHRNPRMVISNEEISRAVLGSDWYTGSHSIAVHIGRIREKLGADAEGLIVTKRGIGYMFDPRAEQLSAGNHQAVELTFDADFVLVHVEPLDSAFLGWLPEQVIGTKFVVAGNAGADAKSAMSGLFAGGTREFSAEAPFNCADGSLAPGRMEVQLLTAADGSLAGAVCRLHLH